MEKDNSLDILGIKPVANAVKKVTSTTLAGASAFLSRICLPVAEEFGLLLKDKVSSWRAENALAIVKKAEEKLTRINENESLHAHPRLVTTAFETGSFSDNPEVQEMWAGLLASSCDREGKNESNLLFMTLLSQINSSEALLLNYICQKANKTVSESGLIWGEEISLSPKQIQQLTKINDIHRMDRELDHLRSLDLISGGFGTDNNVAEVAPRPLALHMYVACQGSLNTPLEYFSVSFDKNPYKEV